MSDERLTNSAVRVIESTFEYCNSLDVPSFRKFALDDGSRCTDRRTGGVNFGTLDASELPAMLATAWEVELILSPRTSSGSSLSIPQV